MSTAFASLCDIYALVMDANVSPRTASAFDVVNKLGIWFNYEFCALQRGSVVGVKKLLVTQIEAISPEGWGPVPYWSKDGGWVDEGCGSGDGDGRRKVYARGLGVGRMRRREWWEDRG